MVRLDAARSPHIDPPPVAVDPPQTPGELKQVEDAQIAFPPTNLYSDEPPLETDFHRNQIELLIRILKYWWRDRNDVYISGNLTVYYSAEETKKREFRGPDVFVVLGAEPRDRRSWTIWEEGGKYPNVVIELLSDSTAAVDRGTKKALYQDIWRLPEYYWFHPETLEFKGFRLVRNQYEVIEPTTAGRLPSEQLGLELGINERQLRWFTVEGQLIPLPEEIEQRSREEAERRAEQERQAREHVEQQAGRDRQELERLRQYLRSQGLDPDHLPEV